MRLSFSADGVGIVGMPLCLYTDCSLRTVGMLSHYRVPRGRVRGPSEEEHLDADRETIQRLSSRTLSVTKDWLESLRETGRLDLGEFGVLLDLQMLCQSCGTQHFIETFFDQNGCDCKRAE